MDLVAPTHMFVTLIELLVTFFEVGRSTRTT